MSDEADGADRRIVVGTGRDLDKQDRYEVTKHVARDWDVWKLSLLGPVLWSAVRLLVLGGTLLYVAYSLQGYGSDLALLIDSVAAVSAADVGRGVRAHSVAVLLGATLGSWILYRVMLALQGLLGDIGSQLRTAGHQLRHLAVLFDLDTWLPQNYWYPFTSHLSDRDPLVVLSNADLDAAVSGAYVDIPYYKNVFVDAVYVRFEGLSPGRRFELWWFGYRVTLGRRLVAVALLGVVLVGRLDGVALTAALACLLGVAAVIWFSVSALPAAAAVVTAVVAATAWPVPLSVAAGPTWTALETASVAGLALYVVAATAFRYVRFHRRFYGNSAGFSRFGTLTGDEETALFGDDAAERLGNSLVGYGIFYVSEFLWSVVGDRSYHVETAASADDPFRAAAADAGTDLLRSAAPRPHRTEEESDVTATVAGVDFVRHDWSPHWRDSLSPGRPRTASLGDGDDRVVDRVGDARGVRLPVKRFVSVPWWAAGDATLDEGPDFYFDAAWRDEEVHYLLLGGAEHQEGLVAFIRYLKSQGYENVDLLENAFADEGDLKFVSEYFVSSVIRGDEDFRGDADENVFLFLRHRIADDPERWVHVLYGMGALESKMGFLYWYDAFADSGFDGEADVLYRVSYTQAGIDDVGDLYTDPDWCRDGPHEVDFDWTAPTEWLVDPADDAIGCAAAGLHVTGEFDDA